MDATKDTRTSHALPLFAVSLRLDAASHRTHIYLALALVLTLSLVLTLILNTKLPTRRATTTKLPTRRATTTRVLGPDLPLGGLARPALSLVGIYLHTHLSIIRIWIMGSPRQMRSHRLLASSSTTPLIPTLLPSLTTWRCGFLPALGLRAWGGR